MDNIRFHLQIPDSNVRVEKYEKTGGGENFTRENHVEHGKKLIDATVKIKDSELSKKDFNLSNELFIQIETPDRLSVKSEKVKLEKIGLEVIGFSPSNKSIGTAKISKSNLVLFETKLKEYTETDEHTGKSYFSILENISSIPVESKIKVDLNYEIESPVSITINLFNALSKIELFAINQLIISEVKKYSNDYKLSTFVNGVTSISCSLKPTEIPKIVKEFNTIKEIKSNYITFVETSTPVQNIPEDITVNNPESNSTICVIDSGINTNNNIFKNIVNAQVECLPIGAVSPSFNHGSFVASRCVFGDDIDSSVAANQLVPYCSLLDVQVFGKDIAGNSINPDEFHLRTVIQDIVLKYHDTIKVYNLSLGSNSPINDFEFSDLAKLLDYLSKEYKVLFVVAAGNINELLGDYPSQHFLNPKSRIGCPAESILSLTVGSVAKYSNSDSLSEINEISPFSRIGPGADLGIKPELVAHGGNLIKPYLPSPRVSAYGINDDGINLCVDNGTSYSAPIISQYAQKLFDLYPNSNPNLIRALLCHFAEKKNIPEEITDNIQNYFGFGEPTINKALAAQSYNAAYIYEGNIDQNNYQFVKFHIPESLSADNKNSKLRIRITLTYDPPVNPDNSAEYSMSRISAQLIKQSESGMKPINISGDEKYNLPWNPIIQFEKNFTRAYFTGDWELRLRLYTRGNIDATYLQDYALVIEIIDDNKGTDVYNDIISKYSEIYTKIRIRIAA